MHKAGIGSQPSSISPQDVSLTNDNAAAIHGSEEDSKDLNTIDTIPGPDESIYEREEAPSGA